MSEKLDIQTVEIEPMAIDRDVLKYVLYDQFGIVVGSEWDEYTDREVTQELKKTAPYAGVGYEDFLEVLGIEPALEDMSREV